jgi:hypothetical protein
MSDRNDRSDRLRKRFDRDAEDSESTDSEEDETVENVEETSIKDRPSVLMYLPEETRQDLDIRFDELNARHKREHGEPLEKNRDYYPAVIQAGLSEESLETILDL